MKGERLKAGPSAIQSITCSGHDVTWKMGPITPALSCVVEIVMVPQKGASNTGDSTLTIRAAGGKETRVGVFRAMRPDLGPG